jgi:hypothetical protein
MSTGSASAQTMEAEPPDMRYQALPGNEYNHLGLLYSLYQKDEVLMGIGLRGHRPPWADGHRAYLTFLRKAISGREWRACGGSCAMMGSRESGVVRWGMWNY